MEDHPMDGDANMSNAVSPSPKRRKEQGETGSEGGGDEGSEGSPEKRSKTDEEAHMPSVANKGFGTNDNTVTQQQFPYMTTRDGHQVKLLATKKGTFQNVPKGIEYHQVQVQGKPAVGSAIVTSKTGAETAQNTNPWITVKHKKQAPIKAKESIVFSFKPTKKTTNETTNQISAEKDSANVNATGHSQEHQQPITNTTTNPHQSEKPAPTTASDQQKTSNKVAVDQNTNPWQKASTMTQKNLPVTMTEGEERIVEIAMNLPGVTEETVLSNQVEQMRFVLKQILHRGRKIVGDKKFGIQPIFPEKAKDMYLGTIMKTDDINSLNVDQLRVYLAHVDEKPGNYKKKWLIKGRNSRWRIKFKVKGVTWRKFCHLYQVSKFDNGISGEYFPIRPASSQGEYSYQLGFWMNSSDKQLVERIEDNLSQLLDTNISLKYDNMPGGYKMINDMWAKAKKQANGDTQIMQRCSPQSQCIYCDETDKTKRIKMVEILNARYGKQDKNEEYPKLADGTRMRFVPAAEYLSTIEKEKLQTLIMVNTEIKKDSLDYPLQINDTCLNTTLPNMDNKTIGECILNLYDHDRQEMIFRHFTRGWNREYEVRPVRGAVMSRMAKKAKEVLRNLPEVLGEIYGSEVENIVRKSMAEPGSIDPEFSGTLKLDISDRYLNGKAKCIIEGMDKLHQMNPPEGNQKTKIVKKYASEYGVSIYEDISVSTKDSKSEGKRIEIHEEITALTGTGDDSTMQTYDDQSSIASDTTVKQTNQAITDNINTHRKETSTLDTVHESDTSQENERKWEHSSEDSLAPITQQNKSPSQTSEKDPSQNHSNANTIEASEEERNETSSDQVTQAELYDRFYEKWGFNLADEVAIYNSRSGRDIYKRKMSNFVPGIDLDPSFFKHKGVFPCNADECERVIKEIFIGDNTLDDEEEEILFRFQVGMIEGSTIERARKKGIIDPDSPILPKLPRRMDVPKGWIIDNDTYITEELRQTLYRFYAIALLEHDDCRAAMAEGENSASEK